MKTIQMIKDRFEYAEGHLINNSGDGYVDEYWNGYCAALEWYAGEELRSD